MNNIKFICDSSANWQPDPTQNLAIAPLKITMMGQEYRDDEKLNLKTFVQRMRENTGAATTSCPSVQEWLDTLKGSTEAVMTTITGALSGSYSSAQQAAKIYLETHESAQVLVINSRSAGPELRLITEAAKKMLQDGVAFAELEQKLAERQQKTHLVFCLKSLHNLSLNGRVKPAIAKITSLLHLGLVGIASDEGKLEPTGKARGAKKMLKAVFDQMKQLNYHEGKVYIDHVDNELAAKQLKETIVAQYPKAQVTINPCLGLCSFYAEDGGLLVGFEE